MSEDIFEPFEPAPAPAVVEPPKNGRRKNAKGNGAKRQPRRVSRAQAATPAAETAAAVRQAVQGVHRKMGRPRKVREATAAPTAKLDAAAVINAVAGLAPEEASLLSKMVQALQNTSKKSRPKIVGALGKLFA